MEQTESEQHRLRAELAAVVDRRGGTIIERWLQQITRDAAGARVPLTELRDGIHDYLKRLAALLRSRLPLDGLGQSAWSDVAREHAITRVRLGFDVTQLFHELVVLRQITYTVLFEERIHDRTRRIEGLIDMAIAASIKSYIDYRDYLTRKTEAEHIGFLTHELRNPLAAASMASDQLATSTPEQRHLHDIIERSLQRIRTMIDDVLLSERLQVGEVESHPLDLTLGPLLSDTLEMFLRSAHDKGIELRTDFEPELHLRADPALTLSAIENLIDNAIKYTDAGEVTFTVEARPSEIVFHVRDGCDGLAPEELRVIFEPFKRVHASGPGSGLGLAIARRAVEAQGGTIHAESSAELGCHFWFAIPTTEH